MKRCLIVSGGTTDPSLFREEALRAPEILIAADSALGLFDREGILPTHAVGDFDSVDPDVYDRMRAHPEIRFYRHDPVKDDTDTALAVRLALSLGAEDVTLLGATGTRLDHTLANIQGLYEPFKKGVPARILDPQNRITLISGDTVLKAGELYGKYISFFPLGGVCEDLTLTGFAYPLKHYRLTWERPLCVSNEPSEEEMRISCKGGILICMETKD